MENFFQPVFLLLTRPPGNLVYYLVLAFSISAALQSVLVSQRGAAFTFPRRMIVGLSLVLASHLILFYSAGLVWQKLIGAQDFLPSLERAVASFGLVWMVWLWAFPHPNRTIDLSLWLLNLLLVLFFIYSAVIWSRHTPSNGFNQSELDRAWQYFSLAIILIGICLLVIRRPETWTIGLGFLTINLAGHLSQLLGVNQNGDFPAAVRLAQLCAYPVVPFLAQRLHPLPATASVPSQPVIDPLPVEHNERRRYTAAARTAQAWLELSREITLERIIIAVSKAVGQTMLADRCCLVNLAPDGESLIINNGYSLIQDDETPGTVLDKEIIPLISEAVRLGQPLHMQCGNPIPIELQTVCTAIGFDMPANLIIIPLIAFQKTWGSLWLFSLCSNRIWEDEDLDYLSHVTESLAQILQTASQSSLPEVELKGVKDDQQTVQARMEQLEAENRSLASENKKMGQTARPDEHTEALIALQKESQELISRLQAENQQLKDRLIKVSPTASTNSADISTPLKEELKLALQEVAQLQHSLEDAHSELRWLDQFKNDSLVDLGKVIDQAIIGVTSQIRDQSISLRVDLPEVFPQVITNPDALQKILILLLKNASTVTHREGTITLHVHMEEPEPGHPTLIVKVTDQGERSSLIDGFPEFTPSQNTEKITIQGSAGTDSNLSYTRTLVEAIGGKIWVEKLPGQGSTVHIALPVRPENPPVKSVK